MLVAPVDPAFPAREEDSSYLAQIAALPVRPVFIMGLHRSGTTFLYDCIARCFPVAHFNLYHLFYYDRLLANRAHDLAQRDRDRLNGYLRWRGIADRGLDATAVDADAVEEYGFLLRQRSGTFKLCEQNAALFQQLCQKLLAVQPGSCAVLLKNPWDTGNAQAILRLFPQARFVYITREPMAILNSLINALLSYLDGPQDYLELLLSPGGSRRSYRWGYLAWIVLRALRRALGRRGTARLFRPLLARSVARQLAVYRAEIGLLPAQSALEVSYDELVAAPAETMVRLQALLGLPLSEDIPPMAVRKRNNLNPALEGYDERLKKLMDSFS